jgi:hypothetical protein
VVSIFISCKLVDDVEMKEEEAFYALLMMVT